ncbi:hypothetical protein EJ05DRAFT_499232 [Pseudovirgaria hyperparasitica]|uniref:Uncharacterized protein n=1 Tax=Pseudovirgaria hyperparasitica TaxID=470096 RepID=A0A6A6WB16_9PEZI|nr:uncharacterized protein EJ05DRAFT_499232 [Pseudovirgaria hyperparasitica]KAF2760042.1 hypothetical protein EJ05DRAFT_499232 [Pseudovirgaria hyperparasitica]
MADGEDYNEDDLFADIYETEDAPPTDAPAPAPAQASAPAPEPEPAQPVVKSEPQSAPVVSGNAGFDMNTSNGAGGSYDNNYGNTQGGDYNDNSYNQSNGGEDNYPPIGIKEDGTKGNSEAIVSAIASANEAYISRTDTHYLAPTQYQETAFARPIALFLVAGISSGVDICQHTIALTWEAAKRVNEALLKPEDSSYAIQLEQFILNEKLWKTLEMVA